MIKPITSKYPAAGNLKLDDFFEDDPKPVAKPVRLSRSDDHTDIIAGVTVEPLVAQSDSRGFLHELLTLRDQQTEPIVHVYRVTAKPGSVRAWVYHRRQDDRLAYTHGQFEVVLYDIRPNSPTKGMLNIFILGEEQPALLRIPAFVIHGVRNAGKEEASFVNMPTQYYNPNKPDKSRIRWDDPRIPYSFERS